ncbi:MAG TPA: hypothetical protein VIV60_19860 [Polyangiaceae bacterium]
MQVINKTRIKGSAVLLTLIVSGLFTNCDWCGTPTTKGVTTAVPPKGVPEPVAACGTAVDYYHFDTLTDKAACSLSVDAEIAKGAGHGAACLYKVMNGDIQQCPGTGTATPLSATTAFTVFWTICNNSDRDADAADVKPYNLQVYALDPATQQESSTPYKTFPLTQPVLKRCDCVDVGFNFNDGGANALPAGTYYFRLDGVYEVRNINGFTRGCAPAAGFDKISIQ